MANKLLSITSLKILGKTFRSTSFEFSLCDALASFYYNNVYNFYRKLVFDVGRVLCLKHFSLSLCFSLSFFLSLGLSVSPSFTHIHLLQQPNKIHICVASTGKPTDYKFMKMYCALIVASPDTYLYQRNIGAGDGKKIFYWVEVEVTLKIRID